MTTAANFDGARPVIGPDDAVMLLIDHQSGLFPARKRMIEVSGTKDTSSLIGTI
jgi:hypothetical protein